GAKTQVVALGMLLPQPVGAVGDHERGNGKAGNSLEMPEVLAGKEGNLLLEAELFENGSGVQPGGRLWNGHLLSPSSASKPPWQCRFRWGAGKSEVRTEGQWRRGGRRCRIGCPRTLPRTCRG